MDVKAGVLEVLNNIIGEDLSSQMDENLFDSGLLDSMATVELLLDLENKFGIQAPVSEFNREDWDTANKIIAKVESLLG
ncbi:MULTISPECIES: D-alanine--poly(phosphoribitol) ligase subunit DltC [Fructobacillus]|jgi:D-alanine--poly(phosphoribitol) ligase subunit 2|uniref:D-alanyl carrier protein n=4 Tax=Fructobacillus TaxID=559173 RepID=A0A3F3HG00_9LACO|nr:MULTISPECIES: D-alanine--poly(phosphoribitol) ligase subunit DltC [Fructobacillus]CAK1232653.1 Acyl carrier protein (AcpP) [Fructobacillus sp. LMG 32999]KMK53700.1 D-alanine--poly(phosphoribitol) ligase subunit 2 [Fructobacillus sp. EFB-N1]MCK8628073.1 D-alanine--poly(phosphoribitol) ligase subunit DltC [Fructobacillus cardui]NLS38337.1 D-alanine--poly(phosphoribitol) ligase subunit DltC [Fructobacillus tropaeoli]USS91653.1 D-alanine--poly(phosphoribitol) ligase subunit DltC [Fructobacillus